MFQYSQPWNWKWFSSLLQDSFQSKYSHYKKQNKTQASLFTGQDDLMNSSHPAIDKSLYIEFHSSGNIYICIQYMWDPLRISQEEEPIILG